MSTLIVYPDAGSGSTTVDGSTARSPSPAENWATIRAGAGEDAATNATQGYFGMCHSTTSSGLYDLLSRALYTFNTATIGAGSTISSATLSLRGALKALDLGSPALHVVASTPAANNNLQASDFGQTGDTSFGSVAYASFATDAYNDIALDANGIANVSKTGISRFATRLSWDLTGDTPTWASNKYSYLYGYFADNSGTTNDPKLTVVYATTAISKIAGVAIASVAKVSGVATASISKVAGLA